MKVGFVGAGRMGRPMVRRLVEAGHQVRVLARSAPARTALTADGAEVITDVVEAAAGADAVIVCVHTDEQVRQVVLETGLLAAMPTGATVVVHTTGSPRTVAAIAECGTAHGIQVLDAPVSGGPHDIAAGRLTLFVGGADDTLARVRPVLASYADPILHVGPSGTGQRVKLVNNALFAAQVGLLWDSVRLGTHLGVAETVLLSALPHGSAQSRALTGAVSRGSVASFAESTGEFLTKDVRLVRTVAAECGGDLGALDDALNALAHAITLAHVD